MSTALYVFGWILLCLIIIGAGLIILFGRQIDQCRTSKVLYCYAGDNGWRCDSATTPGAYTLKDQLANMITNCGPIDCTTLGDALPVVPGKTLFSILPFDTNFSCSTVGGSCDPLTDATSNTVLNFPGDPLTPTNGKITGEDLMSWFCNPNKEATAAKIIALNSYTHAHPDAYLCKKVVFNDKP